MNDDEVVWTRNEFGFLFVLDGWNFFSVVCAPFCMKCEWQVIKTASNQIGSSTFLRSLRILQDQVINISQYISTQATLHPTRNLSSLYTDPLTLTFSSDRRLDTSKHPILAITSMTRRKHHFDYFLLPYHTDSETSYDCKALIREQGDATSPLIIFGSEPSLMSADDLMVTTLSHQRHHWHSFYACCCKDLHNVQRHWHHQRTQQQKHDALITSHRHLLFFPFMQNAFPQQSTRYHKRRILDSVFTELSNTWITYCNRSELALFSFSACRISSVQELPHFLFPACSFLSRFCSRALFFGSGCTQFWSNTAQPRKLHRDTQLSK